MSRPRLDLANRYGKLTVISDMGGTKTLVRCDCGEQKWVLRSNLRAGRIQSCGRPGCRVYSTGLQPRDLNHSDRAPSWLPTDAIPGFHARAEQPGEVAKLAIELQVSDTTIYTLLREIRERGGIDAYMDYITETEAVDIPVKAVSIKAGEVAVPALQYDPNNR